MKNHCGEFFHLEPFWGFGSDFVYAKFSEINVIIQVWVKGGMSLRNGMWRMAISNYLCLTFSNVNLEDKISLVPLINSYQCHIVHTNTQSHKDTYAPTTDIWKIVQTPRITGTKGENKHVGPIFLLQFPDVKCMVVVRCAKFEKLWIEHSVCMINNQLPTL